MTATLTSIRQNAVKDMKRELILQAARRVFEREGLEKTSLRAIAREAGYTPAALYFHFDSKEALYAELLGASLDTLGEAVTKAAEGQSEPAKAFETAALAYFDFYLSNPKDLDLGFYLSGGGMARKGVGRDHDTTLNTRLLDAIRPVERAAIRMGASRRKAQKAVGEFFAYANGVLLLAHTGRLELFEASAQDLMKRFVASQLEALTNGGAAR